MAVFWFWNLPSLPLWCLISISVSCLRRVRVRIRWPLGGTGEKNICLHIPSLTLAIVGCPGVTILVIIPLPWHGDRIQQFIPSYILDQSSQIICGESSGYIIHKVIGSQPLIKKQSCLLKYLPSDVGTPNPGEF